MKKSVRCPRCGKKELTKKTYEDTTIYYCIKCEDFFAHPNTK